MGGRERGHRALGREGLSEDGLHANDRQYEAWAEAIWSAVGARWADGLRASGGSGARPAGDGRSVPFGEEGRRLSYGGYLRLPELLALQVRPSLTRVATAMVAQ